MHLIRYTYSVLPVAAMAIASLRYDASSSVQERKSGVFVYDGNAARFHEREFRTSMRARSSKEEDRDRTMNNIIESLRGEAGQVAMDLGEEELMKPAGVKVLIDAMRRHVFPQARAEAN